MMETARAAIYGIPLKDTVKVRGDDGRLHTLNRSRLVAAQTPQIFHRDLLMEAHKQARLKGLKATDDASLVEAMGVPVVILEGSDKNRKVTTRDDIPILSLYLKGREVQRIGTGYDVHRLVEGRPLILGGVRFPLIGALTATPMPTSSFTPSWMPYWARRDCAISGLIFLTMMRTLKTSPAWCCSLRFAISCRKMLPHRQFRRNAAGTAA